LAAIDLDERTLVLMAKFWSISLSRREKSRCSEKFFSLNSLYTWILYEKKEPKKGFNSVICVNLFRKGGCM